MKILICNDDGIHAPGIMALYEAIRDLGEIQIVAPASEMSAVGHAITSPIPLPSAARAARASLTPMSVSSTAAQCASGAPAMSAPPPNSNHWK